MGGSKLKPVPILGSPSGVLQIHTHYATDLISEDFNGKSDPYVKLFINGELEHKSKTVSYLPISRSQNERVYIDIISY